MGFDLFPFFAAFAPDAASAADAVTVHNCWRYRRMPGFEPDILRPQTGVLPMRYTLTYPYILFILKVFDASVQFLECEKSRNLVSWEVLAARCTTETFKGKVF